MKLDVKRLVIIFSIASLTLGLAPYYPEPHLLGKIKWIAGGGEGMGWLDYFDLILHGFPWLMLLLVLCYSVFKKKVQ